MMVIRLLFSLVWVGYVQSEPYVALDNGGIIGKLFTTPSGNVSEIFLGIPFAEPPIGDLRFADPVPKSPWVGNISATQYSHACYQNNSIFHNHDPISEDCLYLNVLTSPACRSTKKARCPVLFYTHGGANEVGSSRNFPEESLVDLYVSRGIVVVTNNYRMGVAGFWNTGLMDGSDNFALKDIILSLQWAQNNVAKFGGDPTEVTMMGYSSSAIVISSLTLSPRTEGLFHRAILISGTNFCPNTMNVTQQRNRFLANMTGCDPMGEWGTVNASKIVACMRNVSMTELNEIYVRPDKEKAAAFFDPEDYRGDFYGGEPTPFYDGPNGVFPATFEQLRTTRRPVPLFVGTTSREYSFDKAFNSTKANLTARCREAVKMGNYRNPEAVAEACVKRYERNAINNATGLPPDPIHSQMDLANLAVENDRIWYVPTFQEALSMTAAGAKVFLYQFEYFEPEKNGLKPSHADDLKYISGNHHSNLTAEGLQVQKIYVDLLVNFIKVANPNGKKKAKKPWKPVQKGQIRMNYNVIDLPEPTMQIGYHLQGVLFWQLLAKEADIVATFNRTFRPFRTPKVLASAGNWINLEATGASQGPSVAYWLLFVAMAVVGITGVVAIVFTLKNRKRPSYKLTSQTPASYNTFTNDS